MTGYLIYRSCWLMAAVSLFVLFGWVLCVATIAGVNQNGSGSIS